MVRLIVRSNNHHLINSDKLTYAENVELQADSVELEYGQLEQVDICEGVQVGLS